MSKRHRITPITRVQKTGSEPTADQVVVEAPLSMTLTFGNDNNRESKNLAVTMRTPGNDKILCAGFLLTEGIIDSAQSIEDINIHKTGDDVASAEIKLSNGHPVDMKRLERNIYTNSSCGMCSKPTLDSIEVKAPSLNNQLHPHFESEIIYMLPQRLEDAQISFDATGGMHAAALFDQDGGCTDLQEDVGRHNAVDKLIGKAVLNGQLPLHNQAMVLSGRGGFELIQKAHVAGIAMVLALGAPTTLAISLAHRAGITLIGFLKRDRFNIYTHPHRISHAKKVTL